MAMTAIEPSMLPKNQTHSRSQRCASPLPRTPPSPGGDRSSSQRPMQFGEFRLLVSSTLLLLTLLLAPGCRHASPGGESPATKSEAGKTAGITVVKPEKRDIRMTVVQPGTIEAFETAPIYSRISGYVERYNFNIGDRIQPGDVLLEMWIPDLVEELSQRTAMVKRADVQIRVVESALRAAEAKVETARARVLSADAGVKRAQASYTRWESEYKRLVILVKQQVLDDQVRDETYRQFEEAAAARDQANAMVSEMKSALDQAIADRDRARVDVESARADLVIAQANERLAKVNVEYGRIKAPFRGVITQRNISPGDYLQPGGGGNGRPLFVVEQIDPVRVFMGVPELASFFVHDQDTAVIRFQALPGATREGKVIRSGFSLNPSTRTLQTEIDIPNSDGHLHPGWYVTVEIVINRKQVWTLPSNAIGFQGGQHYFVYFEVDGKPVHTPVIVGPSDDRNTEVIKKFVANASTNDWPEFDGSEKILVGNMDALAASVQANAPPAGGR
jgi:HlyD family secretion protein